MPGSSKRGFGSMNQEKQRAIARKGGQAGHAKGTAHEFTPEEAREAGRKGGEAVSRDREHMAEIARKGGRDSRTSRGASTGQAASSTRGRRSRPTDRPAMASPESSETATDLLRADHERVKGLFHDYESAEDEELELKKAIAEKVFVELDVHSKIEEEIFYPAAREQAGGQGEELVNESLEEHDAVKGLIEELRGMAPQGQDYENKFQDLIDNVLHHAEEEESELLPLAEEKMGDVLHTLAAEMAERRRQLMSLMQVW
jgi:general stress protein YciG/hemerythrin-like domain-containing protein